MTTDGAQLRDTLTACTTSQRPSHDRAVIHGHGVAELRGPDGELKQRVEFTNLVTQIGDQYYGERATGVSSPPAQATGMQLGTGTTTPSKTGAGAAIVTLVTASLVALNGTPASSLSGSARRIQFATTWTAGTATANDIAEVALVNQSTGTQTAAPAANTIARALLSPTVNKAAGDSLTVTWNHDIEGS